MYKPSPAVIAARRAAMAYLCTLPKRTTKAQNATLTALNEKAFRLELAENPELRAEMAARSAK